MNDTCSNIRMDVPDYLDGTLPAARQGEIHQHLRTCADCLEYCEFLEAARIDLKDLPGPMNDDRYWDGLKQKIHSRISRLEDSGIPEPGILSWLIPKRISRWAYVGFGVATVILLIITGVYQHNLMNEQETAVIVMENPLAEPWVSEETVFFQSIVDESAVPATFTDFALEDTLSESCYLQVLEDDPFYFMSLLDEEDSQEFLEYL